MRATKTHQTIVVGAGVFGAWTAWWLRKRGEKVLLVDALGPANARASSGGGRRTEGASCIRNPNLPRRSLRAASRAVMSANCG